MIVLLEEVNERFIRWLLHYSTSIFLSNTSYYYAGIMLDAFNIRSIISYASIMLA